MSSLMSIAAGWNSPPDDNLKEKVSPLAPEKQAVSKRTDFWSLHFWDNMSVANVDALQPQACKGASTIRRTQYRDCGRSDGHGIEDRVVNLLNSTAHKTREAIYFRHSVVQCIG